MTERSKFLLASFMVYLAAAGTGVLAARQSQQMRTLFDELEGLRAESDAHLIKSRELLLEHATVSAYHDVEDIARAHGMRYPEDVRRVAP